jgi:hypothetical protein
VATKKHPGIIAEQGLDQRWAIGLDATEIGAVERAWTGGSLRKLRRMVEVIPSARAISH